MTTGDEQAEGTRAKAAPQPQPQDAGEREAWWDTTRAGLAALGLLVALFFFDLLFLPGDRVLSKEGTDIFRQFAGWRSFGFSELRGGNFPLWTPYVYGGMPYFSGFQSALLYPPNWIYLFLPLAKAINWGIALHLWWAGAGIYLLLRNAGIRQAAALFGGVTMMFCAPHFLHLYAGHLTNLCVMAWAPWLLLCLWRWRDSAQWSWVIAGGGCVGMQIFAGHPQYVYYTAIVMSVWALLSTGLAMRTGRLRFLAGVAVVFLVGALLAAVQLLPGLEALGEGVRSGGTGKAFAGSYSFPPENLLTHFVPGLFGDMEGGPYWGRWFYWEMAAFAGVVALCLAVAAVVGAVGARRRDVFVIAGTAALAVLLALGSYTPLFHVLYEVVPGYSLFRGSSKFMFFVALFVALLAGVGANTLLAGGSLERRRGLLIAGLCAMAVLWGVGVTLGGEGAWSGLRRAIWESGQVTHLSEEAYFSAAISLPAKARASSGFWLAGGLVGLVVLLGAGSRKRPALAFLVLLLGAGEILVFAARFRSSFPLSAIDFVSQANHRRENPSDVRALDVAGTNRGMLTGIPDLWGDDPGVLARYAEFMATTQGVAPGSASQHLPLRKPHPLWAMLRTGEIYQRNGQGAVVRSALGMNELRRFELVPEVKVAQGRDAALAAMHAKDFDPRRTVILDETRPGAGGEPIADGESLGTWTIEREDTDEVVVQVEAGAPCVLLMTDPYSKGWKVRGLGDGSSQEYELLPANYLLRGIPLDKGTHRLKIYFRPGSLIAGAAVTTLALAGCGIGLWWARRRSPVTQGHAA